VTWPAFVLMILVGLPIALLNAALMTLFQRNTTDAVRGRVFGSIGALEGVTIVAGTVAAGFLGRSLGIVASISAQGIGPILGGAVVLLTLRRSPAPLEDHSGGGRALGLDVQVG
jgi:hypothetical protein